MSTADKPVFRATATSVDALSQIAHDLLNTFENDRVFAFYAPMGAGKTTFIQALCSALGSDDIVTSPTFALVNEYQDKDRNPIFHFDFYRIEDLEEVYDIGYEEYIYSDHFCFIEWPEMIAPLLPERIIRIEIEVTTEGTRNFKASRQ